VVVGGEPPASDTGLLIREGAGGDGSARGL